MNIYFNTISYSNDFPSFLKPHQDDISKYFSSNHIIDSQDNELIKYDTIEYIMKQYVNNTSNELICDDIRNVLYDFIEVNTIHRYVSPKCIKKKKK